MWSWRFYFSHLQNWLGLLLVLMFVFMAIFAPFLSPNDPENLGPSRIVGKVIDTEPQPPSKIAPLGTLPHHGSVYHTLIWGSRSALIFGLIVTSIGGLIGVLIGVISAYSGGFLNKLLMRFTDAFLSFPVIAGVVLIQQLVTIALNNIGIRFFNGNLFAAGTGFIEDMPAEIQILANFLLKVDPVMIALILFSWMPYARITNAVVTSVKRKDYVLAARAIGARHLRIIFRHLLPNSIAPAIVLAARDVGGMVVLQAAFVFIGFGTGSPWGSMLVNGRDWIYSPGGIFTYWWVFLPVTLALVLFGIGWNLLGDGLNDALNPRSR